MRLYGRLATSKPLCNGKPGFCWLPCENMTVRYLGTPGHRVPLHLGQCVGYTLGTPMILLKRSPHCGDITLDSVLPSVSMETKDLFVEVFMTDSTPRVYSNCLTVPGEEPSPVSTSFSSGGLGKHLVVGFLRGIFPAT
jgi:hypothetical protein